MNKQKPGGIGWCDYTWGPVTGCWGPGGTAEKPNRCAYCYAQKITNRFNKMDYEGALEDPFIPIFWNSEAFGGNRLLEPAKVKKPSKIFVCSMADLFGDWVPSEWILDVLAVVRACPQHTFQFLTKNPRRLSLWNGTWPSNCWVGTTVTNQADADERLPWLLQVHAPIRFVSHEPLISGIDFREVVCNDGDYLGPSLFNHGGGAGIDWAIIGAMTGPGAVKVDALAVASLVCQYHDAGVPVFMKNNLKPPMGRLIREFPGA